MKILKITFILFAFLCVSNMNNEAYTQESDITSEDISYMLLRRV